MKLKDFVECLDIFQGIKLINHDTKKPLHKPSWDFYTAELHFGNWNVYKAYTEADDEDIIIEITREEI